MTSQQAQLQALINEIEALLGRAAPRLPWKMTNESTEQRRVMEQTLNYLKELQSSGELTPGWGITSGEGAIAPEASSTSPLDAQDTAEAASQQVLKALLQEMQYLRAQMVQPLTNEVMALQQQREVLKNEVRQLELDRLRMAEESGGGQLNPAWLNEVVGQLQSSLLEQITPQLRALQAQISDVPALYGTVQDPLETSADLPQLSPQQRLEQLRQIQAQTDYMLLRLDANLRAVFESLDQSIQSYCDTLNQGLDAMHGLGQQGEFIFRTFINHLGQQLQEESGYLTSLEGNRARLQGRGDDLAAADEDEFYDSEDRGMDSVVDLNDVDLEDFDLNADVDEEITLFQLDEELSDLPLGEDEDLEDLEDLEGTDLTEFDTDEEPTIIQTAPISWEAATGQASDETAEQSAADLSQATEKDTVPYTEEIDSLYASLFGESGETPDKTSAIAADTPTLDTSEESVDEPLLNTTAPDIDLSETVETAEIKDHDDSAAPAETAIRDLIESDNIEPEEGTESPAITPSLEYLLGTELAEELTQLETSTSEVDIISSLTELLPSTEPMNFQQFADPFSAFDESGDNFIQAPHDEDLLTVDTASAETSLDLTLNDATLGQLSSDLSELEGLATEDLQTSSNLNFDELEGETSAIIEPEDFLSEPASTADLPTAEDIQATPETEAELSSESEDETSSEIADLFTEEPAEIIDEAETAPQISVEEEPQPTEETDPGAAARSTSTPEESETELPLGEFAAPGLDIGDLLTPEADTDETALNLSESAESPPEPEAEIGAEADPLSPPQAESETKLTLSTPYKPPTVSVEEASLAIDNFFAEEEGSPDKDLALDEPEEPEVLAEEPGLDIDNFFAEEAGSSETTDILQDAEEVATPEEEATREESAPSLDDLFADAQDTTETEAIEETLLIAEDIAKAFPTMAADSAIADEASLGVADLFPEAPEPAASSNDSDDSTLDLDMGTPMEAEENQIDEWLGDLELHAELPEPEGDRQLTQAPEAETESLSLDNIFEDTTETAESTEASAETVGSAIDELAADLGASPWEEPTTAPETETGITAEDFDMPVEPADQSDAVTAENFDMPVEPLSLETETSDEDYSLTLEDMSWDLEIPDFSEEELSLRQGADDVDRAIADTDITLDDELFPDSETDQPASDQAPGDNTELSENWSATEPPTAAETLEDWTSALDEAWSDTDTTEPGASPQVIPNEGSMTPDTLIDELESGEIPTDIPPVEADDSIEDWAESFADAADTASEDVFSLDNLDLDLSLDITDETDEPSSEFSSEPTGETDLFAHLLEAPSPEPTDDLEDSAVIAGDLTETDTATEASGIPLTGNASEGFELKYDADSFDQLLQTLITEIPEYSSDSVESAAPFANAAASGVDQVSALPPPSQSEFGVTGSSEAGFQVLAAQGDTAIPEALEAVPTNDNPSPAPDRPAVIIGYPEAQEWPERLTPARSLTDQLNENFTVQGSADAGFQFTTDASLAASQIADATANLSAATEDEFIEGQPGAQPGVDESLQRSYGRSSVFEADDNLWFSATALPFAANVPSLIDMPAPHESMPAAASPTPTATPAAGTSTLRVQGSPTAGFEVTTLDDQAFADTLQQLASLGDLPDPTATSSNLTEETVGMVGLAGDRPPRAATESPTISEISLPELNLSGSPQEGFSIAEEAEPSLLENLEERLMGESALADESAAVEGFWTPSMEDQMAADFAAEATMPARDETAGPLSEDEFADFFPPSDVANPPEDESSSVEEGLDFLFSEEAEAPTAMTSAEAVEVPPTDRSTDEVDIDAAIAGLTGEAILTDSDIADATTEEADLTALFPPETEPPAIAETSEEAVAPPEDLAASAPVRPETDLTVTPSADERVPDADASMSDLSLEEVLFDDSAANITADSADWDPMDADFDPEITLEDPSEIDAEISTADIHKLELSEELPTRSFEDIDLAMEEIPAAEIENDEAFRSAFEEDFSIEAPEAVDEVDSSFDLNELGNPSEFSETEALQESTPLLPDLEIPDVDVVDEAADTVAREEVPPAVPTEPEDTTTEDTDLTETEAAMFASSGLLATIPSDEEAGTADPDFEEVSEAPEEEWFLGIDLGTTGISAVLMEHLSGSAHPLCWLPQNAQDRNQTTFRMPAIAALKATASDLELEAVGLEALPHNAEDSSNCLLNNLRSLLRVGIPHQTTMGTWEPMVQWTDDQTVSLQQILNSVQALLSHIQTPEDADLHLEAVGLDTEILQDGLDNLQGIVVGMPTNWSDTYCLNVREAILAAGLVESSGQIFFLEEAIAAILSGLPDPSDPPPEQNRQVQTLYQCNWQGGTVVISGGASCTEVGIADLPYPLDAISREDFKLRNLAYGGDALDLDIICQLLVPAERRQTVAPSDRRSSQEGWSWQTTLPEVANAQWDNLALESLDLPQLAEPDISARIRLRQHLESSKLGQSLLEAARYLKLILQNQNQYHLELADQSWRVLRRDLESRVLVPYIQRLNQQVNALLSQTGLSSQGINQVICTGGNASFNTIAKWLRQKFPNATIIQDTYPSNRPQTCSRVAYGLVNLCRYPQVLDVPRHQYSDYFLLHEIIRVVPETPMPLNGILHLLEEQGINIDVCHSRIEAILEGHLPPGLISDSSTRDHLSRATLNSATYQGLTSGSLFTKQTRQIYMLNTRQRDIIGNHLAAIMLNKHQTLTEPMIAQLVTV